MSTKYKKYLSVIAIIIVLITLGYVRDFIFVNINYALQFTKGKFNSFGGHSRMNFLINYDSATLIRAKWILTLTYSVLFWLFSSVLIFILYKNKFAVKYFTALYIALLFTSFCFYLLCYIDSFSVKGYALSRDIMGIVQSPIPLMLFIPAAFLFKNSFKNQQEFN